MTTHFKILYEYLYTYNYIIKKCIAQFPQIYVQKRKYDEALTELLTLLELLIDEYGEYSSQVRFFSTTIFHLTVSLIMAALVLYSIVILLMIY